MHIIAFLLFGLVVGLVARALFPGRQSMGVLGTALLGIGGSVLGGVLGNVLFGGRWDEPVAAGWIGSIVGSILLLCLIDRAGPLRA